MIVKILWKSKTFRAVRYNTNKVEKKTGELVKVSGFGALQSLSEVRPEDYLNYLSALASRNKRIIYPQFHAMISPKGRSLGKTELVSLAEKWLEGMGYGNQPYLLIFHKDTQNNHIHMVSSRVDREGKKISDRYEKIRAYRVLHKLIGKDETKEVQSAILKALQYQFSTRAQFMMLLESRGYALRINGGDYEISKSGEKGGKVSLSKIDSIIHSKVTEVKRQNQLKEIFEKYRKVSDAKIFPTRITHPGGAYGKITGYSSALCEKLSSSFGLQFIFHFKNNMPPYGYTILDHVGRQVFKGGEIMELSRFVETQNSGKENDVFTHTAVIMDADSECYFAPNEDMLLESPQNLAWSELSSEGFSFEGLSPGIDISDDIDDEQILGRNRRRQRKARTNTR